MICMYIKDFVLVTHIPPYQQGQIYLAVGRGTPFVIEPYGTAG